VTAHLSPQEAAGYARAALPADELLRIDDHLAACADCRARVGASPDGPAAAALRDVLTPVAPAPEHVSYEQLEGFVDGRLDDYEQATVEAHLDLCGTCAEDLSDLRNAAGHRPARPAGRWIGIAAAGAAAAGFAVWFVLSDAPPERGVSGGARATSERPPDPITPQDRDAIAEALRTGTLPIPSDVRALRGEAGVLMAPGARGREAFRPLRPVGTAVRSGQPVFEWTPVADGASYTVSVFTEELEKIAEGVVQFGVTWTPAQALPAGRRLLWQVRARAGDREILIPQPPSPQARFRTLTDEEARQVEAAEARYAASPLALALAYARAGLIDEARAALEGFAAANPGSADVQRLIASLSSF
jgi:hypothetical protein